MANKPKPSPKVPKNFEEAVQILANTPPISNKEIVKQPKKSKKKT